MAFSVYFGCKILRLYTELTFPRKTGRMIGDRSASCGLTASACRSHRSIAVCSGLGGPAQPAQVLPVADESKALNRMSNLHTI